VLPQGCADNRPNTLTAFVEQREGIAKAKAAGVYRGRKPSVDAAEVKRLKAEGLGASQIAKRLKIGRASVYRVLEA
jgi:DNA invertase Pin-like site-specific DNA recombinase